LAIIIICVVAAGIRYFASALYRASDALLFADKYWPGTWPYPDRWPAGQTGWYDASSPAPPDKLKQHGELPRVRLTVALDLIGCLFCGAVGARMCFRHSRGRRSRSGT
jgi:hypothetical protein